MHLKLFQRYLKSGQLTFIGADGARHQFGSGSPSVTWRVHTPDCMRRIMRNPLLNLGETYMDQAWDVPDGSLHDLLVLLRGNIEPAVGGRGWRHWAANVLRTWNHLNASRRNVSHHYDLDEQLFRTLLDRDMHYSCAYFEDGGMSLESAQRAKARHISRKLLLKPGQRVLDIGSGWGSMAMHLAADADVHVTGLTLSREQLAVATAETERRGLSDQVEFRLEDYREHHGRYDRVVSIGMFEHVGRRNFRNYFDQVRAFLRPGGIALLHTIGNPGSPQPVSPWIQRYIFPGGYVPSLSDLAPHIERAGLLLTDLEVLRQHYALTLKEWNRRFQQNRAEFAASKGERFCRMWEFYLSAAGASFELGDLEVFQFQLSNDPAAVPVTRNYLYPASRDGEVEYVVASQSEA